MFTPHGRLRTPPDDTLVWRYVDLPKFVAMLSTRSIYFTRLDALEDPFEGMLPRSLVNYRRETYDREVQAQALRLNALLSEETDPEKRSELEQELKWLCTSEDPVLKQRQMRRRSTAVSCWHMNAHESVVMWKTYASAQAGIAIKSTVGRLKQSFRAIPEPVFVAQVEYRDYETVELVHDLMNVYVPAFWKQAAFAAEAELRCAVFDAAMSEAGTTRFGETGVSLPADLETMIDSIVVSPAAPPWYRSAVAATVHKFGLNREVQPSVLTTDPSF